MRFLLIFICSLLLFLNSACDLWTAKAPNAGPKRKTANKVPFSTKEPEVFQAKMVFMISLGAKIPSPPPQEFFIRRAGDKRRVDFEREDEKLALIQTPSGHFALNLTKQEYTEVTPEALKDSQDSNEPNSISQTSNPFEKMLNQVRTGATYEKLGQEQVDGRMTTKYRISSKQNMDKDDDESEQVLTESLIWIDESLGMPIKSETTYTGQNARNVRSTMEVHDIKLEPPPASAFDIPKGFKKREE